MFQSLPNNITHATTHAHSNRKSKYKHTWKFKNNYDINIQRQELDKGMIIANTIKVKLKSQQTTNALWIVKTIKAILKTPIQKFGNPIFSFRRTYEAAVRNRKILLASKGDLVTAIAAQKDRPINYGSGFCNIVSSEQLFLYHEENSKIINIFRQGSCYHIDPIKE